MLYCYCDYAEKLLLGYWTVTGAAASLKDWHYSYAVELKLPLSCVIKTSAGLETAAGLFDRNCYR